MKGRFRCAVLFIFLLTLSACGFHLREPQVFAPELQTMYVNTTTPNDPFVQTLNRVLMANNVDLVSNSKQAKSTLNLLSIATSNTMMASGGVNVSGSYQAYLTVVFSVLGQNGKVLIPATSLQQSQNFMSNATQVLSGNSTAMQLTSQMQESLAQSIVNQLAKIPNTSGS